MLGTLFTRDFLEEGVKRTPEWRALATDFETRRDRLRALFGAFPFGNQPNEAATEDRLVYPVTEELGWLRSVKSRTDDRQIPDALLFLSDEDRRNADAEREEMNRVRHADALLEAKRWGVPFDRRFDRDTPPMAQLMGYLARAEIRSNRRVRWGVLTDGRKWRLSFMGAASLLTDFLEIDLAQALGLDGIDYDLLAPRDRAAQDHSLKLFLLFFGAVAFRRGDDGRSFHERALAEGKDWEERVRKSLSETIFGTVFPGLIRGLKDADRQAPSPLTPAYLAELRDAAFTFLYRLLFTLYAEDRDLLPKRYPDYDDYGLSKRVREDIEFRIERPDVFSLKRPDYYDICLKVFEMIDEGDESVGVPPFNGGLFAKERAPLLNRARIPDRVFAPLFDALARTPDKKRINYRDLSVRELGAVYEKLLEYEPVADADAPSGVAIRLNTFARKGSGSYYTPDELVTLIIERTVGPLVAEKLAAFADAAEADASRLDPASAILQLKVCDPAMGSGHFLVALVDYLADKVFTAIEAAREKLGPAWQSPVSRDAEAIRERIKALAAERGWHLRDDMVDDRAIVRRMVLKRCVFGVDKNPQAVELAKVALWLHTLTAGAPLSFLDHHLKCGDSLFGEWVRPAMDALASRGGLLINQAVRRAEGAAKGMALIESLTDADMAEAEQSRSAYDDIAEATAPLRRFLDFWHAVKWLDLSEDDRRALGALWDGAFGDAVAVAAGMRAPDAPSPEAVQLFEAEGLDQGSLLSTARASVRDYVKVRELIGRAHALAASERFLHWQIAFPLVWRDWTGGERQGGFDAVIGNPPWDRMKMQEVEWFAARAPAIARQPRAADRKRIVETLLRTDDPLAADYRAARARAETGARLAVRGGDYPLLGRGDVNLYSLFVERAQSLIAPAGIAGLLVPSGIASDLTASHFFKGVAATGRIAALLDFENRRGEAANGVRRGEFFPDVDSRFKFCAFVVGGAARAGGEALCGFFLSDPPAEGEGATGEGKGPDDRFFRMSAGDFLAVNPNTGTAPIFRARRDAELTRAIYRRLPVLVNRSGATPVKAWPVEYQRMFDMTNDSGLFWTRAALEQEGAYPTGLGRWRKGEKEWMPLYVGRMIHHFDHRAASVTVNEESVHNAANSGEVSEAEKSDPEFAPTPQYWVETNRIAWPNPYAWGFAYRDIARSTDERTAIGTIVPKAGFGNTAPLVLSEDASVALWACFSSFVFDYVCRQKAQSTHLNWYIVEQLPVIPPEAYARRFGPLTAGEIVRDHVLRLSYTAWDLEAFARDLGHVDSAGETLPPFRWDEDERRQLRARLDALYFHLYGLSEDEARYVLSTFPIVRRKDEEAHEGVFLTEALVIWYMRALAAGDPTSDAPVSTLLRQAKAA